MQEAAAKRYSTALFEAGKEKEKVDLFLEQLRDVSTVISANAQFVEFITHPNINSDEKIRVIKDIFDNKVEAEILNLLLVLIEHGRIGELSYVYQDYKALVYDFKGIKIAKTVTAVPLNEGEIQVLKDRLGRQYNASFEIEEVVDPSVLGGMLLKVDDEVIDGTIKGNLEKMRKELMKQGSEVRS